MLIVLSAFAIFVCSLFACSDDSSTPSEPIHRQETTAWARQGGGEWWDDGRGIVLDSSGNIVITGSFEGEGTFDGAPMTAKGTDILVAKYDSRGGIHWARRAGGSVYGNSGDRGWGIAADAFNNLYVVGQFMGTSDFPPLTITARRSQDGFVAKYSADGFVQWVKQISGSHGNASTSSVTTDPSGNIIAVGRFGGDAEFGTLTLPGIRNWDAYVVKYSASGQVLWADVLGWIDNDFAYGVTADGAGNVVLVGAFGDSVTAYSLAKYDKDGDLLWRRPGAVGRSVVTDDAGSVLVTGGFSGTREFGSTTLTSKGLQDIFVARYDPNGDVVWARNLGGPESDTGLSIQLSPSGPVVTGRFAGQATFGSIQLTSTGDDDIFVALLTSSGGVRWAERAGGVEGDIGYGVTADEGGTIYLTGSFADIADFGTAKLECYGRWDAFLCGMKP